MHVLDSIRGELISNCIYYKNTFHINSTIRTLLLAVELVSVLSDDDEVSESSLTTDNPLTIKVAGTEGLVLIDNARGSDLCVEGVG